MKMKNLTRMVVLVLLMSVLFASFCGCATEQMNNIKEVKLLRLHDIPFFCVSDTSYKVANETATISELLNMFSDLQSISNNTRINLSDIEDPWLRVVFIDDNDEPTVSITVTDTGECYLYSGVDSFVYKMKNVVSTDDLNEIYKNARTANGYD